MINTVTATSNQRFENRFLYHHIPVLVELVVPVIVMVRKDYKFNKYVYGGIKTGFQTFGVLKDSSGVFTICDTLYLKSATQGGK